MVVEEVSQCIFEDLLCASTILGTAESVVNKKNNKIFKEYMFQWELTLSQQSSQHTRKIIADTEKCCEKNKVSGKADWKDYRS